jgi:ankyrin repeat protein
LQVCILSTARDALKVSYMVPLQACAHGHVKCAETLLDAGALISAHKTNGFTPLHYAAAGPHLSIVRLLISRGVAVDAPDHKGERAVDVAARVGSKAVVQALLDSGADVNARTNNGRSWFASFFHTGFFAHNLMIPIVVQPTTRRYSGVCVA